MAKKKPEGLDIHFQGYACLPIFEYSRSVGLEPDYGYVHLERADFRRFTVKDASDPPSLNPNPLPPLATREKLPAPWPKGDGLLSLGDLVVSEVIEGEEYSVTWKKVMVSERAIESVIALDDPNDLVRVEITDIRYLWGRRGVVFGWINVPRQDDGKSSGAAPTTTAAGQVHPANALLAKKAPLPPMIPGSLKDGKNPWTLRQVLEQKVLPALPGSPQLSRLPKDLEGANPVGHVWDGYPAKHALSDLLDEFQLILSLDLDANVSLWHENEGPLQTDDGQLVDTDEDDRVTSSRALVAFYHVPAVVLVLGAPIRMTEKISDLEPVGEIQGEIVPLDQALRSIGLNMSQAKLFATATHDERSTFFQVSADGLREFERWAFKWYRLPGGTKANAHRLPIEDRGVVDEVGQFLPPRVYSESFAVARTAALLLQNTNKGEARAVALDALKAAKTDQLLSVWNVAFAEQTSGYEIDRRRGIVKFHVIQGAISQEGSSLKEGFLKRFAHTALEFGYDRKPQLTEDVKIAHRYHAIFVRRTTRDAQGNQQVSVQQVQDLPANAAPLVIERPDFLQVVALDGTANQALLDSLSLKVARDVFSRPVETLGAIVQFHRPIPLANTGLVRSVVWSTDAEVPRVVAHVGAVAPQAPSPEPLRTRARTGPHEVLRGSVVVPRGLRP